MLVKIQLHIKQKSLLAIVYILHLSLKLLILNLMYKFVKKIQMNKH